MKIDYEAVIEIDDIKASEMAINDINDITYEAIKKIENVGKPIKIPKKFYKRVLIRIAKYYGVNIDFPSNYE